VEPDRGVVRSDAEGRGHGGERLLVQVHALDHLRVVRLQRGQEPPYARADLAAELRFVGGGVLGRLTQREIRRAGRRL
jgi:hypothetical protein